MQLTPDSYSQGCSRVPTPVTSVPCCQFPLIFSALRYYDVAAALPKVLGQTDLRVRVANSAEASTVFFAKIRPPPLASSFLRLQSLTAVLAVGLL